MKQQIIISFFFLFISFFSAQGQNHPVFCGDANVDGKIDVGDLETIEKIILEKENATPLTVDYDVLDINKLSDFETISIKLKNEEEIIVNAKDILSFDIIDPLNGHEYVDLGLSSLWATCNYGANTPTETGLYVNAIENSVDQIRADWGDYWGTPRAKDYEELLTNCIWRWEEDLGGYNVIGPNEKSIFLPAAGYLEETNNLEADNEGFYWTDDIFRKDGQIGSCLHFTKESSDNALTEKAKIISCLIRPVIKQNEESGSIEDTPWEEEEEPTQE